MAAAWTGATCGLYQQEDIPCLDSHGVFSGSGAGQSRAEAHGCRRPAPGSLLPPCRANVPFVCPILLRDPQRSARTRGRGKAVANTVRLFLGSRRIGHHACSSLTEVEMPFPSLPGAPCPARQEGPSQLGTAHQEQQAGPPQAPWVQRGSGRGLSSSSFFLV